jgi:hypothetical protein
MPTSFFPSVGQGRAQEISKLLSGQEKLARGDHVGPVFLWVEVILT